ncbi:MAG: tetratricopeptide repeat protein [Kiritimatiellae bacterium]|nr:tetratricopeptide repeat protein [Kiritimatiellia bacterium]
MRKDSISDQTPSAWMHCARYAFCLATVATLAGCSTAHDSAPTPVAFTLSTEDHDTARALTYFASGLIEEDAHGAHSAAAMREYAKAAEFSNGNKAIYMRVAEACIANGLAEKAILILGDVISHAPHDIMPYKRLASAYQQLGNTEAAIAAYVMAITKNPKHTELYLTTATMLFQLKHDDRALSLLEVGIPVVDNPEKLSAFCYNRGRQFISRRENERAIGCFKVLATFSRAQRSHIYNLIGQLQEAMGMSEQALDSFRTATQDETPVAESFARLASRQLQDAPNKAISTLREGIQRLPEDLSLAMALGNVYAQLDDYPESIRMYERVSSLVKQANAIPPEDFFLRYGATCERAGNVAKAAEIFENCIQYNPSSHQVLNYLAYMLAENGLRLNQAMQYANRALTENPESPSYLDTRGWVHFKLGQYRAALDDIVQANTLEPGDPVITDHLGDIWSALGNRDRALEHWTLSYRADADNPAVVEKLQANGVSLENLPAEAAAP